MRRKRRRKHRKHREVDEDVDEDVDEEIDDEIISRSRRETFNLDLKLRLKLCEDPSGEPLTPGTSDLLLPVLHFFFRFLEYYDS